MGDQGAFGKIYAAIAAAILASYLYVEAKGTIFTGTDSKSVPYASSTSGGRVWGTGWGYSGGYSGGK